jgi:hypothetical protein
MTCRCGCGGIPEVGIYLPGHDAIHRHRLIDEVGGVDNFEALLKLINDYQKGDIDESELAKGVRRLRI